MQTRPDGPMMTDDDIVEDAASRSIRGSMVEQGCTEEESDDDSIHSDDDLANNTYEMVKKRFELTCLKVRSPHVYLYFAREEPDMLTASALKDLHANLYYFEESEDGDAPKRHLFIRRWIGDVNLREYMEIVVDPQCNQAKNQFNLWRGFLAAKLPPVPDSSLEDIMAPIIKHFDDVVTGGNASHTSWLLDYMARILQQPHKKTQVAVSLFGVQGAGKGIIFEFFREHVLGDQCSFQTSDPQRDLLSPFSNGHISKVFVQVDELKSLHEHGDPLKNLITAPKIRCEKKGKDAIVVRSFVNCLFTSNNDNTLPVSVSDRRFVLFKCLPTYKGNKAYFNNLAEHLNKPEVARGVFQFLMKRDVSQYVYDMQDNRPITEFYRSMQRINISPFSCFMSAMINSEKLTGEMEANKLYVMYCEFFVAQGFKAQDMTNNKVFGAALTNLVGKEWKTHTRRGASYRMDAERIKAQLVASNEFDVDSAMS